MIRGDVQGDEEEEKGGRGLKDLRRGKGRARCGQPTPDFWRGKADWAHHRPSGLFVGRKREVRAREGGWKGRLGETERVARVGETEVGMNRKGERLQKSHRQMEASGNDGIKGKF